MLKEWQTQLVVVVVIAAVVALATEADQCTEAWLRYGISVSECPVGEVRQTAAMEVAGLRRGETGRAVLRLSARYTTGEVDDAQQAPVGARAVRFSLVDGKQVVTPLPAVPRFDDTEAVADITLPEVPDGDYRLRASYETLIGKGELDVALPLYTPARIHVITDRPLYEPGNTVRFRAVALRARDLAPLDGRPGAWVVTDPNGEVVLEEKAAAGAWGIVAGTFPLDAGAPVGAWQVAWRSASATESIAFTVQPFTLPRFRVEASTDRAYYRAGDAPVIRGAVVYSSGAPVERAALDVAWQFGGDWPPPRAWQETLLPKRAVAGANGRFELALPKIPADLAGAATIVARISAIDPAGDRATGEARVLLSADGIRVSSVTELGDGLVQGFNNRLYVRVTTPDGREVPNAKINVKRAWQGNDNGIDAVLDEDGVASLQLDPGAPVNVVIPAAPYRPAPRPPLVTRGEISNLLDEEGAPLADQLEMDRWLAPLSPCAKWRRDDDPEVRLGLRVDRAGAIAATSGGPDALAQCVLGVVRGRRLAAGAERLYAVLFQFADPDLPSLSVELEGAGDPPDDLTDAIDKLARAARDCLPRTASGRLPRALMWRTRTGSTAVELGPWLDDPQGDREAAAAVACATQRLAGQRVALGMNADEDVIGVARFTAAPAADAAGEARPQPTTMLGYELTVTADLPGAPSAKLRVTPGTIPDLRLRVSPILAKPGDEITAQLIRGPNFRGELPKELELRHLKGSQRSKVGAENTAVLAIAPGTSDWVEISGGGVRALVYVKPAEDLAIAIAPKQPAYKPGDMAQLQIETRIGGKGAPAALGLFGVDDSLAQLVPLPGAGDLARVQPKVETSAPAFGMLDGQALALGRIRGANAAAATVLRVSEIPKPPELDAVINASALSEFDPIAELTDNFYRALTELHVQARRWDEQAPPAERMSPSTMAALWKRALAACEQRGERIVDAYGRALRLVLLPPDLLALIDPRVVVGGARLPEDIENWAAWVARERP